MLEVRSINVQTKNITHRTCNHSLRTEMKLSFRDFRVEKNFSGERVNLRGIRLLFPEASKIPA